MLAGSYRQVGEGTGPIKDWHRVGTESKLQGRRGRVGSRNRVRLFRIW